ncbi:MAG: CopG family transcriptional regulator [Eubacteriales bacterium]|nr:CopG family transcriptional regulator [Eubacteriales bacterium]
MNAKPIGRPKAENPKSFEIRTRVDEETNNRINVYCEKEKITRSTFLRKGIDLALESHEENEKE